MNVVNTFMLIAFLIMLVSSIALVIVYLKQNSLDQIRADVYQVILKAEHIYYYGDNIKKKRYVIRQARGMIPPAISILISDKMLETIIEFWFKSVKDLLDDGKMNGGTITKTTSTPTTPVITNDKEEVKDE